MRRGLGIVALAVSLLAAGLPGDAEGKRKAAAKVGAKATAKKLKKAHKGKKKPRKAKRARKLAKTPRQPKPPPNMPAGWIWPPSDSMRADGEACLADLDALGVRWEVGPAEHAINTPVIVADMDFAGLTVKRTRSKGPIVMDCALARALARDASPVLRGLGVRALHVGQIHMYREIDGKPGVLSRHSLGLAMDVYALVTDDGVEHVVERDYLAGDPVLHGAELLLGRTGAFRTLLTPGNDPGPHHDHFHIEARAFADKVVRRLVRGSSADVCAIVDLAVAPGLRWSERGWLAPLCRRAGG
jgi:hypothetical protein